MTAFTSLLVANRGEIALRIMKTARRMGMRCIAVFTDADAGAPHVTFADQAVNIGPGPVTDSYLCVEKILEAARVSNAQAIHPGYGFLSEDASFAQECVAAGLAFVGPAPEAIRVMGNKAAAKRLMIKAEVPVIPGYEGQDQSDATLLGAALAIGFPLMIKAAAGGGGRGMRLVSHAEGFSDALNLARNEALSAFGSSEVILEKAINDARHIEVQVFADRHGTTLHLGERDCSLQRRHQKVIEECPAPGISPKLRERIGRAAVQAAMAVAYEGAGTVEFLLTGDNRFYFLEMNTRLQVEHPVTELVVGHDLVELQIEVAQGKPLAFEQADVTLTGHAIEARIYAEDPANGFLPDTGPIHQWRPPQGDGVRVDGGIVQGQAISAFYDPMMAKIIVHSETREKARAKLTNALRDMVLLGVRHNRGFLCGLIQHPEFANGGVKTGFIDAMLGRGDELHLGLPVANIALAAALIYRHEQQSSAALAISVPGPLLGWSSSGVLPKRMQLRCSGQMYGVVIYDHQASGLTVSIDGHEHRVSGNVTDLRVDEERIELRGHFFDGAVMHVATAAHTFCVEPIKATAKADAHTGAGRVTAPMHGQFLSLDVVLDQSVTPGMRLGVLEAMKMQHEIRAEVAGVIRSLPVAPGAQVKMGTVLVEIEVNDRN